MSIALAAASATAQPPAQGRGRGGQPPEPPKNLQVLPKDWSRQQVLQVMQGFAQGLGVRCDHCHVQEDGQIEAASDTKAEKQTARVMMRMTADLNRRLATEVDKAAAELTRVQCVTCHRGVAVPKQLADILTDAVTAKGAPAAVAQWRDLRKQYYGAQAYDFSENGLAPTAQRLLAADKPDDALTFLQLNLETYPRSAATYGLMAQAYQRKKDRANAIKSLEKVLEIDPKNRPARRQLDELKQQ